MESRNKAVGIENAPYLILRLINDCPKNTVVRELLMNALEASGPGDRIEWSIRDWEGVPKLSLYNEGSGMSADELETRMKISSSGKGYGVHFGIGAKTSGASASPYGLVYRSCRQGIVSQIWLQVERVDETSGRLVEVLQADAFGGLHYVMDITQQALMLGYNCEVDWTEAILLGRDAADQTAEGTFIDSNYGKDWLIALITQRFYSFAPGIQVYAANIPTGRYDRRARSLSELLASESYTARAEEVHLEHPYFGPMTLVYGKLAGETGKRGGGTWFAHGLSKGHHICMVYNNEIYDFSQSWYNHDGAYGFMRITSDHYVHIIFNDDAPVKPSDYRDRLLRKDDNQGIHCLEFAPLIREFRPQWILDAVDFRMNVNAEENVDELLRKFAEQYKQFVAMPIVIPGVGDDAGMLHVKPGTKHHKPSPKPRPLPIPDPDGPGLRNGSGTATKSYSPDAPKVRFKDESTDEFWYQEYEGLAGQFDAESNYLWLSRRFAEYNRLCLWIDIEWPSQEENDYARRRLDHYYHLAAGKYIIGILTFRKQKGWKEKQWLRSLTPEAISGHLRDPQATIQQQIRLDVRKVLKQRVRDRTQESHPVVSSATEEI